MVEATDWPAVLKEGDPESIGYSRTAIVPRPLEDDIVTVQELGTS